MKLRNKKLKKQLKNIEEIHRRTELNNKYTKKNVCEYKQIVFLVNNSTVQCMLIERMSEVFFFILQLLFVYVLRHLLKRLRLVYTNISFRACNE